MYNYECIFQDFTSINLKFTIAFYFSVANKRTCMHLLVCYTGSNISYMSCIATEKLRVKEGCIQFAVHVLNYRRYSGGVNNTISVILEYVMHNQIT